MARHTRDRLPGLLRDYVYSKSAQLTGEVIGLGENALLSCKEMMASASSLVRDNQKLMHLNRRIKDDLASEKKRRNSAGQVD
jgi:cell shape-determining protein MreC